MNRLGYVLLQRGRVDDAIAIFALNVEAFPQSGNVYDSLAEAYMSHGERELVIRNYAKSLELDPGNANAVRQLQALIKR